MVTAVAASAVAGLGGLAAGAVARALARHVEGAGWGRRLSPAGHRPGPAEEAQEREQAVLDLLASDDPARLVVFTLRRARGYAAQARDHHRTSPGAGPGGRRRRGAELGRLEAALNGFRVSGVPVDDLLAVRRLERRAYRLAASTRAEHGSGPP